MATDLDNKCANDLYQTQTNECNDPQRPATLSEETQGGFNYHLEEMSRYKRKLDFLKSHPVFEKLYEEFNKL